MDILNFVYGQIPKIWFKNHTLSNKSTKLSKIDIKYYNMGFIIYQHYLRTW